MTLNELIENLLKLQAEGKGDYKMKWACYSDEGDILDECIVIDEEQVIIV